MPPLENLPSYVSAHIAFSRTYSMRQSRAPTASQIQNPPPPSSSTKAGRFFGRGNLGMLASLALVLRHPTLPCVIIVGLCQILTYATLSRLNICPKIMSGLGDKSYHPSLHDRNGTDHYARFQDTLSATSPRVPLGPTLLRSFPSWSRWRRTSCVLWSL